MGLGLSLRADFTTGGTFESTRTAPEFVRELVQWFTREARPNPLRILQSDSEINLWLHPGEEPVFVTLENDRTVEFAARTSSAGPGYHAWLVETLKRAAEDLSLEWQPSSLEAGDETDYFGSGDFISLKAQMLEWLQATCQQMHQIGAAPDTRMRLSMDTETIFDMPGLVHTQLGPRDEAWISRMITDPDGGDFWPWPDAGFGPTYSVGLAKLYMWNDVRWRSPVNDEERSLLNEVNELLANAYSQSYYAIPWREWREIRSLLQVRGDVDGEIDRRAMEDSGPLIGYRRFPVKYRLFGWQVTLDGDLATEWDDKGTFTAYDSGRWLGLSFYKQEGEAVLPDLSEFEGETIPAPDSAADSVSRLDWEGDDTGWVLKSAFAAEDRAIILTMVAESRESRDWIEETFQSVRWTRE